MRGDPLLERSEVTPVMGRKRRRDDLTPFPWLKRGDREETNKASAVVYVPPGKQKNYLESPYV